jgi:histidine triad (HIT) family protein
VTTCVFCEIVAGRVPADIVHADDHAIAFLDRAPVFKGHVLVVPRAHVVTLADLPATEVAPFFSLVQRVSAVMPLALDAHGTFVAMNNIVSQSVPHLHAHVVPRRRKDGLRGFFWPRVRYVDDAERAHYTARLEALLRNV